MIFLKYLITFFAGVYAGYIFTKKYLSPQLVAEVTTAANTIASDAKTVADAASGVAAAVSTVENAGK